jgi:hypothetical protein
MKISCMEKGKTYFIETIKYAFTGVLDDESLLDLKLTDVVMWGIVSPKPEKFCTDGPDQRSLDNASAMPTHVLERSTIAHIYEWGLPTALSAIKEHANKAG